MKKLNSDIYFIIINLIIYQEFFLYEKVHFHSSYKETFELVEDFFLMKRYNNLPKLTFFISKFIFFP